jgi:hypothetical protein
MIEVPPRLLHRLRLTPEHPCSRRRQHRTIRGAVVNHQYHGCAVVPPAAAFDGAAADAGARLQARSCENRGRAAARSSRATPARPASTVGGGSAAPSSLLLVTLVAGISIGIGIGISSSSIGSRSRERRGK